MVCTKPLLGSLAQALGNEKTNLQGVIQAKVVVNPSHPVT